MRVEEFSRIIAELSSRKRPFAIATVVKVEGSTLGKPGFKIIIDEDGRVLSGTLGGVCPESAIVETALKAMKMGEPKVVRVFLEDVGRSLDAVVRSSGNDEIHVETNCGGSMDVYVEPFLPSERLILIGQGGKDDVEDMLVKLGKMLDFEVIVIDHAPMLSEKPDLLISEPDYDLSRFELSSTDSVVVLTKGERDVPVLKSILTSKTKPRFVGLLASRKRVSEDAKRLEEEGVSKQDIEGVHAPVGVDVGAVTPAEIAVSIMSDVVAVKRGKHLPHKA
ncbi:MAG: XdhC family protein [Conexivisphaerales archaeon]